MDANGHAHDHVLGSLHDDAVHLEQVGLLQRLETEIVVVEVPIVDNGRINTLLVGHDNVVHVLGDEGGGLAVLGVLVVAELLDGLGEDLGRVLMQV
eukprot:evm.model.NODE_5931_length_8511_cov_32.465752.1